MVYYGELGKKVESFWNKISITGYKWSSLNAPFHRSRAEIWKQDLLERE